jgi:hypothetical protein
VSNFFKGKAWMIMEQLMQTQLTGCIQMLESGVSEKHGY